MNVLVLFASTAADLLALIALGYLVFGFIAIGFIVHRITRLPDEHTSPLYDLFMEAPSAVLGIYLFWPFWMVLELKNRPNKQRHPRTP